MSEGKDKDTNIAMFDTLFPEDRPRLKKFLADYEIGDTFSGYDLVDGEIHMRIHDADTFEVKHLAIFRDNGLAKQYIEQEQERVTHDIWTGPGVEKSQSKNGVAGSQ